MKKGDRVELKMQKVLCAGTAQDDNIYIGHVFQYDEPCECIYIVLQSGELADVSQDAIYNCKIHSEKEQINCIGRIRDRHNGEAGKMLRFEIKNGFYKINLK